MKSRMKTAQQTLMMNVAIYVSLAVLLVGHGGFFGFYSKSQNAQIKAATDQRTNLQTQVSNERTKTAQEKLRVKEANEEVEKRAVELKNYGNFLPKFTDKSQTLTKVLSLIEGLGITIVNQDFDKPVEQAAEGGKYLSYTFSLELSGDYRAFKKFLNEISATQMVIRITDFDVKEYGQAKPFRWKVQANFTTYFSTEG